MHTPTNRRNHVIALVEANADAREMYTEFFRFHGFRVVPVETARDALAVAPRVDAIVTETVLSGEMDGLELIARLKNGERTADIPLIVVTSHAWSTDRERAQRAGCDLFLTKPCLPQDLLSAVRRLLAVAGSNARTVRRSASRARPIVPPAPIVMNGVAQQT